MTTEIRRELIINLVYVVVEVFFFFFSLQSKPPPPPPTGFPKVPQAAPSGPGGPPSAPVNMFSRRAGNRECYWLKYGRLQTLHCIKYEDKTLVPKHAQKR